MCESQLSEYGTVSSTRKHPETTRQAPPQQLDTVRTSIYTARVSPRIRKLFTFPIDDDLAVLLKEVKRRDGVSEAEQVRRGIRMWLESKGVMKKAERPRVAARRRP